MNKKVMNGTVRSNREIAAGVFRMEIDWPLRAEEVRAGQFVNVYPKSKETLLPRPISICGAEDGRLTLVYGVVGKGTAEFSTYAAGDDARISSPLGNGYDLSMFAADGQLPATKTALLIGGGIGVPPMLELAKRLCARRVRVQAVLGFRCKPFLAEEFKALGAEIFLATDDGSAGHKGTVLDVIREEHLQADIWFACGPKRMLRAVADCGIAQRRDVQLSLEERMGCGYGACVGCVCTVRTGDGTLVKRKVCKDGPVFRGTEVVWDE